MLFAADVPYVPVQHAPSAVIMVAEANNANQNFIVNKCREVGNAEAYVDSAYNGFEVGYKVLSKLGYTLDASRSGYGLPDQIRASFKMYVVTPPAYGEIFQSKADKELMSYSYRAKQGYVGPDSFVIGVDALTKGGKQVHFKLKYNLSVVDAITNELEPSTCVGMKFSSAFNSRD